MSAHFVTDPDSAARALVRAGFAPTPASVQVNPDPGGGPPQKTGTGNVTAMLDRGYIEFLFKTADTPLAQQFEAAMARYRGLHLVAFAVADAAATHARLAKAGFRLQPLVDMRRPVGTADGEDIAAFSIVRPAPGEMPEGRIQALTHRTEHTVWQERWLSHRNGATALARCRRSPRPMYAEAADRFQRFLGRRAEFDRFGQSVTLDRGRIQLVSLQCSISSFQDSKSRRFPSFAPMASRCARSARSSPVSLRAALPSTAATDVSLRRSPRHSAPDAGPSSRAPPRCRGEADMVRGRSAAVVGGGPAGLMAAERLAAAGVAVTVYDQNGIGGTEIPAGRPRRAQSHP